MTTETFDAEAIACACLDEQLDYLTDMDTSSIVDAAGDRDLPTPHEDSEEEWDRIASAIGQLADRVREHTGLADEGGAPQ